ncbi:filamin-interacting protein FAM101B [Sigmodon hispidus]
MLVVARTGCGGVHALVPGSLEPEVAVVPAIPNPPSLTHSMAAGCSRWLCPLSFCEGVEFDPLPPKEIKFTSSVKYVSEWYFIDRVQMPLGLVIASSSQKSPVSPISLVQNIRLRCTSSPKQGCGIPQHHHHLPQVLQDHLTTTLDYNCHKKLRRFLSSMEL